MEQIKAKIWKLVLMMMMAFLIFSCQNEESPSILILNENWTFKQQGQKDWYAAEVPGNIHTDLLANGLIKDPFYRLNEADQQWIETENWEYSCTFNLKEEYLQKDQLELNFAGLDTHCDVYLNDSLVLKANNMFREWKVPCKSVLKTGENKLHLVFLSAVQFGNEAKSKLDYQPLSNMEQASIKDFTSMYSRKAPFHFGWDWSPRLVTIGVWRPVTLTAWNSSKIDDVNIQQNLLSNTLANLTAAIQIETKQAGIYTLKLFQQENQHPIATNTLNLHEGMNISNLNFEIENPQLWWTHNLGTPFIYHFNVQLERDGKIINHYTVNTGLRTVTVAQIPDSLGRSFKVVLNGIPIFMKGSNYIPQDNFNNRVTPDIYRTLIESVKEANMNMLRVWGGGIYENDIFYDLCDENGILIWQDFMFACSEYPGNAEFLENVKNEAADNIIRLRNHPSIALWCGNNEIRMFHHWKWPNSDPKIMAAYDSIFYNILPGQIEKLMPGSFYWPSSPSADYRDTSTVKWASGNMHYWGVWHNREDFSNYTKRENAGRFMTEFGFQSFPDIKTINAYTNESDHDISSPVMKSHQRNPSGNELIQHYMNRYYNVPDNFNHFIYLSQVMQAEAVKTAVEYHRRSMPFTMGSLYWQLNDCWPVASWSSIDYFGRWKALHYFARKFNNNLLVSPAIEENEVNLYVVSDLLKETNATLQVQLLSLVGDTLFESSKPILISANSSHIYESFNHEFLRSKGDPNKLLFVVKLLVGNEIISENSLLFVAPQKLKLPQPNLIYSIDKDSDEFLIQLQTVVLTKNIYFSSKNGEGHFTDNYFDMNPGSKKEIHFRKKDDISLDKFIAGLKVITLYDTQQ